MYDLGQILDPEPHNIPDFGVPCMISGGTSGGLGFRVIAVQGNLFIDNFGACKVLKS